MPQSLFDLHARTWDDNPARTSLARAVSAAMLRELRIGAADTVLDYGAGTGLVSLGLAAEAGQVVCADTSEGMLEVLRAKIAALEGGKLLPVRWSAGEPWPEALPRPGVVTASMVLHHVQHVEEALAAFFDLLPAGGRLAVADLDAEDGSFHGQDMHAWHKGFQREAFAALVREAGFGEVRVRDVHALTKPGTDGAPRTWTVFLLTARKP